MSQSSEIELLRGEVAALRAELQVLRDALSGANAAEPLRLHAASLEIVGAEPRFRVSLGIEEHGGALHFLDNQAGQSARQAALVVGEEGVSLALCGSDGVPRVVLSGRDEGGGASFIDQNGDLAAEIFGSEEASWLMLNHDGAPRAVSVATFEGGNVEFFDGESNLVVALPVGSAGAYSPE